MTRLLLLPLVLVAACAAPAAEAPSALPSPAAPVAAAAAAADQAQFTVSQEGAVVATERFTRSANRLESELVFPGQARLAYTATLAPDATIPRLELQAFAADAPAGAPAMQRAVATFRGDSVITESMQGDSTQTTRRAAPAGAIPYINPSPVLMEQIIRRARAIGGERVEVPIVVAGSGGQVATATVTFQGARGATLDVAGVEIIFALDDAGRVLSATVPSQNVSIERTAVTP